MKGVEKTRPIDADALAKTLMDMDQSEGKMWTPEEIKEYVLDFQPTIEIGERQFIKNCPETSETVELAYCEGYADGRKDAEKHAHWKHMGDCGVTECCNCGWSIEECVEYTYCPSCGYIMDEVVNDE